MVNLAMDQYQLRMAKGRKSQKQDLTGDNAVGVQIDGDRNRVTIFAGGTRLQLDQPHKRRGGQPTDERELLLTEWRATTLVGRGEELASLADWRTMPASIALRCITGRAGAGKTRLAIEACEQAEAGGWTAGFLSGEELARFHRAQNLERWEPQGKTFIVIDDAAVSAGVLKQWLDMLARRRAAPDAAKLRILLLERHAEADSDFGWWTTLTRAESRDRLGAGDLIGDARPEPLAMLARVDQRRALFAEAMRLAAAVLGKPVLTPPPPGENAEFDARIGDDRLENAPLFLMMAAIVAIDRGTNRALALNRIELAQDIAGLERARLARLGASWALPEDGDLIAHLVACATLQRGCTFAAAKAMVGEEMAAMGFTSALTAERLVDLLAEAIPDSGGAGIDRVRPDLIGEAFAMAAVIGSRARSDHDRFAIIERARHRDDAVIETLILAAQDLAGGAADHPTVRWLAEIVERSTNLADLMRIADALPKSTLALRELSVQAVEQIVGALRGINPTTTAELLGSWLIVLGARLTDLGRREDALAAEQEAIELYRALAAADPGAFTPSYAMTLSNLSVSLSDLGRRKEALVMAREAVELRRALAAAQPGAFTPHLATSLNNLANRLSNVGHGEEALAVGQEAVELYRALAAAQPDAFTSYLAMSLNNLAGNLRALSRPQDALAAAQESVDFRRALAATRPDAFTPSLATSLVNLANCLSDLGRREDALAAAQEATEFYRALAETRPDVFTPDLATSLNNMANFLSVLHRRDDALAMVKEAVELRRALTAARPDMFTPNLATSLSTMGTILEAQGHLDEAMACFHEAASKLSPLLIASPATFAELMIRILRDYLRYGASAGVELDREMLAPILAALEPFMKGEGDGD